MHSTTIAVDLAKSVFERAVSHRAGQVAERRRLSRAQFRRFLGEREPATVLKEACGTAHYWGREAGARGHQVVLLPPYAVRRYVLRNKTDGADTKGLLEAQRNEDIRPVPVKSVGQQVLTAVHRMRSCWMAARTARLNTLRGCCASSGSSSRWARARSLPRVQALVGEAEPDALRPVLDEATREIAEIERRVRTLEQQLEQLASADPRIERLRTIPGIGKVLALTILYEIHDIQRFERVQQFASYARLVKCAKESAGKKHGTSGAKMGNVHLKWAFSEAAVLFVRHCPEVKPMLARWEKQHGKGKALSILAHKLGRAAYSVLLREKAFDRERFLRTSH